MTRGTVVFLGGVSHNAGAGMTGGKFFLAREHEPFVNRNYVQGVSLDSADGLELRALLEDYRSATDSRTATELLAHWERTLETFAKFVPVGTSSPVPAVAEQAEASPIL